MMPLILKLKKQMHKDVARAQDIMIRELYKAFNNAVLHGGTAIWRCYSGNRFSEDVDAYIPRNAKRINSFFSSMEKAGFIIEKKKIGEKSIYSNLRFNRLVIRFDAVFKEAEGILKEYETADGNLLTVYTLTPEQLVVEKTSAYLTRFKVRDLYDIFFLLRHVTDRKKVSLALTKLLDSFRTPVDERELKVIIIEGLVPDIKKMLDYVRIYAKWGSKNT